jgi:hypothetical protein
MWKSVILAAIVGVGQVAPGPASGPASSLRIVSPWQDGSKAAVLGNQAQCSVSFFLQVNTDPVPAGQWILKTGSSVLQCFTGPAPNQVTIGALGAAGFVRTVFPVEPGRVHHVVLSWDGVRATTYVDGLSAGAPAAAGPTRGAAAPLVIGSPTAGIDYQLQDLRVWQGTALSQAEAIGLASRSSDPATAPTVSFALGGPAPGGPVDPAADPGFAGGFAGPSGAGSATYAPALQWVSPLAPGAAHCGKSGRTVFLLARRTAQAVVTPPTLARNGQGIALVPGPVHAAFYSFRLPDAAQTINPADVLSVSAPAGWVVGAPAFSLPATNSAGRCEFPVPLRPKMGLGVNVSALPISDGSSYCPVADWSRRLRSWNWTGTQVLDTDAAGNPTRLAGTRAITYFVTGRKPSGLWTLRYDAPDGQTALDIIAEGPNHATLRPELSAPGAAGIGITKVYDCPDQGGLQLSVKHPSGTPAYANLRILPPGNIPSDGLAVEASIRRRLDVGAGFGPSCIRLMDSVFCTWGGDSYQAVPEDLASPAPQSWARTGRQITTPVSAIRPWTAAASPNLLTCYGPVALPADPTRLGWPGACLAECVTPQPHGLSAGQQATIRLGPSPPASITLADGKSVPIAPSFDAKLWPTSETTFLVLMPGEPGSGGTIALREPITLPGATATVDVQCGSMFLPVEFAAACAAAWDGTDLWVNVPTQATDALIDEMARRILAVLPRGRRVLVELSNEVWMGGTRNGHARVMTQLLGLPGNTQGFVARRGGEAAARFRDVFDKAGRSTEVLWVLAGQTGVLNGPLITQAIATSKATGMKVGALAVAPYFDVPWSLSGWPVDQALDLTRHWIAHGGGGGWVQDLRAAKARYDAAMGTNVDLVSYESAIEVIPGINPWDWSHHPDIADTERVRWALLESVGFSLDNYFNLIDQPRNTGFHWGLWDAQDEIAGTGDGADGRAVNQLTGQLNPANVSVRGHAWREWQRAYRLSPGFGTITTTSGLRKAG